ncbi:MAG TPA: hypothetical protein P5053_10710, partial [Bacteroidia bacterium]|nr:hypothetical protein [Bacteroidia bacterium]
QRELANPNSFENIGAQYKAKALNMSGNNDVEKMIKYGDVNGNMAFLSEMLDDNDKPLFETKSAIDKIDKDNKIYEQQLKSGSITPEQFDAHKKENDKKAIELNTQYVQQMQKRNSSIDDEIKQSEQKLARGYDMKMLGAQPYSVQLTKQEIDSEKKKIKQLTDLKNDVLIDINNPVKSLEKHDGYVQAEKQGLIPTNATNSQKVKIYSYILVDKAKKLATELGYNPNDVKSLIGDELGSNTPKMWWEQLKSLVVGSSDKEREYIHTMAELQAIAPIAILNKNNLTLNEGYTSNLVSSFRKSVAPLFVRNQIATDEDRNTLTKEAFNKAGVNDGVSQAYTDRQATTEKESKTLGKTVARTTGDVVGIGVKIGLINPILDIPAAGIEMAVGKPVLSGLNKALSTSKEVQALEAEALLKAGETATKASEIASIDKAKKVLDIAKVVTEKLPNNFLTRTIYNTTKAGVVHEIQGRVNKELEGFANFEVGAVNHLIGMPLNTLGQVAIRLFGKDAPAFVSQVVHAVQAGTSMTATMAGMTVVNDAKESESFDAFKEKMNEQFGTADKKLRFIAENFLLGLTMHAANISTLSGLFNANYTKLYESLKPEEKAKVDEFVKSVNEDANDFESETKDAVEIVKDENHIPITKDAEVEDAIKPATDGSKLNDIGEGEYKEFIDNGKVAPERLNNIAEKVKNKEDLSEREKAIFADKTAEINDIIKNGSTNNQQIKDETKITPIKPVEQGQQNNDGTGLSETPKEEVEGVSGSALKDVE